jgi:hypothetical protein
MWHWVLQVVMVFSLGSLVWKKSELKVVGTRPIHDHRTVETSPNGPKPSYVEEARRLIISIISADSRPLSSLARRP